MSKVGFITGASRGPGADIAKAALAVGHPVNATGRTLGKVTATIDAGADSHRGLSAALSY
ncbi:MULTISPECIES: hypothetical protein [unclassified Duganella]|uniref:hypothetical protein n=1 Tax=unclassified Duganella TaxID=2636909 RepID=UPI0018F5AD1D|nr:MULTISPECIES: hypothetical protein [unclassified Duganella]